MKRSVSIGRLARPGRRWAHLLTVTLTACLFMNTPGLETPLVEVESSEVLALQSLVAGMVSPTVAKGQHGNTNRSVLDVQRLLGETSGAKRNSAPTAVVDSWAVAPALHREYTTDPLPVARAIRIAPPSEAVLRQRVECFAPPPASPTVERYRMMLTPHAPPSPFHDQWVPRH